MADIKYVEEQLRGLYPTSQKLTAQFIAEICKAFEYLGNDDFQRSLDKHRHGVNAAAVPDSKALIAFCTKARYDDSHLVGRFFDTVESFGWSEAIKKIYSHDVGYGYEINKALREYLLRTGVNNSSPKYFGFPHYIQTYIELIHSGEILEAYKHMMYESPEGQQAYFKRKYNQFYSMSEEKRKTYFPYHRMRKIEEYDGPRSEHFRKFDLKPASDAYGRSERETQVYVDEQIEAMNNPVEKELPF